MFGIQVPPGPSPWAAPWYLVVWDVGVVVMWSLGTFLMICSSIQFMAQLMLMVILSGSFVLN